MSGTNNSSKSGSKSCSSPEDYYEDELVTWLQYPLGESLEKGYCSDLFGQWPSSSMSAGKLPTATGSSRLRAPTSMTAGACTFPQNGSFSSSDCAGVSEESGTFGMKEKLGSSSLGTRVTCAEGALALGAERAAGLVSQSGREEFSKVRTSMQPPAGSQLSPLSSLNAVHCSDLSFRLRTAVTAGPLVGTLPQSPQGGQQSLSGYGASMSSGLASLGKGVMSFTSYRPRNLTEAPIHVPSTQESGCSHITEEASVRRSCDYLSSASRRGQVCPDQAAGVLPARSTAVGIEAHVERSGALGWSEMALAASLSTREASSNSGKRKPEDSESQSEDVEGESSIDVKQPRKASSSKRNRAAEVHNLSERNRRNRINEKLKALQDLIPNSSKTDKASVLDEAIEYMKTLQMQLQMVSMSGLSVSPMMMPLGMPHLQMAPLHPVGLGVPVGHPGLGMSMGLQMGMGMGMGMMDLPQGFPARPPQPVSGSQNQFGIPYQVRSTTGGTQDCSLDSTNVGSIPSQYMPLPHASSQMYPGSSSLASSQSRQQQEQWHQAGQRHEGKEQFNEQVRKKG